MLAAGSPAGAPVGGEGGGEGGAVDGGSTEVVCEKPSSDDDHGGDGGSNKSTGVQHGDAAVPPPPPAAAPAAPGGGAQDHTITQETARPTTKPPPPQQQQQPPPPSVSITPPCQCPAATHAPTQTYTPPLAPLHLAALTLPGLPALTPELDLLLLLLATPAESVPSTHSPGGSQRCVLCCGAHAARHAAAVFEGLRMAGVLRALPPPVVSGMLSVGGLSTWAPAVHAVLLDMHTNTAQQPTLPEGGAAGGPAWAPWAAGGATHDGRMSRTPAEQRQVSNRESCRDSWLNVMREAEQLLHSLGLEGVTPGMCRERGCVCILADVVHA